MNTPVSSASHGQSLRFPPHPMQPMHRFQPVISTSTQRPMAGGGILAPLHWIACMVKPVPALLALLVAVFAAPSKAQAQTILNKGDAVILSFSQSTFSFKWAPLVDLAAGTVIGITDYGVPGLLFSPQTYPVASVATVDGAFTFTPVSVVAKGTIFTVTLSAPSHVT